MRPVGYQLNPTTGVNVPAATYGSGQYGTQTYGQAASDPVTGLRYVAMFDGGYPAYPAVRIQAGDARPDIHAVLTGDDGTLLDLTPVASATLALQSDDGTDLITVRSSAIDIPNHRIAFPVVGLDSVGTYHATVHVTFQSTRVLSAPYDGSAVFVIADGAGTPA